MSPFAIASLVVVYIVLVFIILRLFALADGEN
jgi:hypothetical protein